jgi:adenylosuccinate lyase
LPLLTIGDKLVATQYGVFAVEADKEAQRELYAQGLNHLSTLDGREVLFTGELGEYLSEGALHRYRGIVEIEALIALSESDFSVRPAITEEEKEVLRGLVVSSEFDAKAVADYDHFGRNGSGPFEHDVKSVEVYLRERLDSTGLGRLNEWLHFPMTSEDVNNLAWNLMLRDGINAVWLPTTLSVMDKLADFSVDYAHVPVLGKTHGMNASPTTFGKRFSYTLEQMSDIVGRIKDLELSGKFSGPVGNHNAMTAVVPDFDFEAFAREFVEGFGFVYADNANQRNSHLSITRLFGEIKLLNTFVADLCDNVRHNVMMGWLYQEGSETHVGSSVMPHKINPWFFEVGQGYFEQSSQLIDGAAEGLLQSVFERDLTDHPWERAYGEMLGKSLVGMAYVNDGLDTLRVDDQTALAELGATPEVLSEAVQIAGRIAGAPNIYMTIKQLTRGKRLDHETLSEIIEEHIPDEGLKARLRQLKPQDYIGKAPEIAERTAGRYQVLRSAVEKGVLDEAKRVDAVLFDFDNTLQVGDKDELQARLEEIVTRLSLGFTPEQVQEFGSRSDYREMRKLMVDVYNTEHSDTPITEDDFQAVNNEVSGMFDDRFRLAENVKETLAALKNTDKKVALVTTRGSNSLPRLLEMYGIAEYFDVIINRDQAKERKPHPQPIALALEQLGITDPSRAIYVGDKQVDDVIAGNALGMKSVLISDEELDAYGARPTYHFKSLKPLMTRFGR